MITHWTNAVILRDFPAMKKWTIMVSIIKLLFQDFSGRHAFPVEQHGADVDLIQPEVLFSSYRYYKIVVTFTFAFAIVLVNSPI